MKGFVKLVEVSLAFIIILMVLSNIQVHLPPRYEDFNNMNRLSRISEDVAFSICNNENFKMLLSEGIIPENVTLRADAWNKSEGTEWHDTSSNSNGTARQTTYMNRSADRIKLCFKSAGEMADYVKMSVCEKESGINCSTGTLSQSYTIPRPLSAGYHCTEWFDYYVDKDEVYLVLMYTLDADYTVYYLSGQNGFYWKPSVDETQVEEGEGYLDYSSYPIDMKIEAYYDMSLNESMPEDVDYYMWLYSNDSADWKMNYLVNETGNMPTEMTLQLTTGFNWTTTADFDAGVKENNSGNYYLETYTDNFRMPQNALGFSNKYSDRFTFNDADAFTWKWQDVNLWGSNSAGSGKIENNKMNLTFQNEWYYRMLSEVYLEDAISVEVYSDISEATDGEGTQLMIFSTEGNNFDYCSMWPYEYLDDYILYYECAKDDINLGYDEVSIGQSEFGMRITREWYGSGYELIKFWLDTDLNGTWTQVASINGYSDEPMLVSIGGGGYSGDEKSLYLYDFKIHPDSTVSGVHTWRTGNRYWAQVANLPSYADLESVTINYTNADDYNHIYQLYITDPTGMTTYARADLYNLEVQSGTGITITEDDLDWGNFSGIPKGDYGIILMVHKSIVVTDDRTVYIEEISGQYKGISERERVAATATASCIISGYRELYSPKKLVVGVWNR